MKVCLIGSGRAGTFHCQSINRNKKIDIICIVDNNVDNATKLANTIKATPMVCKDIDFAIEKFSDAFDTVIIATPTYTHHHLTIKCLNAGKHVFCEKPLGNIKQIKECFELAQTKKLKLFIGFQKRFDKHYMDFRKLVQASNKIKHINFITRDHPLPSIQYLKTSNGIAEDMLSHDIDIANLIMKNEKPSSVVAFASTTLPELEAADEIEDISVTMQYSSGTTIILNGSRTAQYAYDQRAEAYTGDSLITMNNQLENGVRVTTKTGESTSCINDSFPTRYKNAYYNELEAFRFVTEGGSGFTFPTCDDLVLNMEICNAINESLKEKKVVQMN